MTELHIRIPDELAEKIRTESAKNLRTLNGEIVHALGKYFCGLLVLGGDEKPVSEILARAIVMEEVVPLCDPETKAKVISWVAKKRLGK